MSWSTACLDWRERIVERRSLVPFDPLFADEAQAALAVFRSLRIVDAPGMPTFGEVAEPFVFDFVGAVFGAYDARSARRLIREFLLLIAKKNGKSTIAAGIMLTALIRNWRHSAELLVVAPSIEVANNSFGPARDMVRHDPELSELLQVVDHKRLIAHRTTEAELKIVAADTDVVSGKKAGFVLVDELWKFGKRAEAGPMLREATGGLSTKPEGFVVYLTTHSDEPPAGVFKDKLDYFRDVRDGKIADRSSFGMLYEFPEEMIEAEGYLDPANFYVTNPNLGKSVTQDWLEAELTKELRGDGAGKQVFLAKHLNVEIGLRLRRDRWIGADYWEDAAEPGLTLDALIERSEVVTAGIDGGGADDLLGVYLIGREKGGGRWLGWGHAFAHDSVWERRPAIASELDGMVAAGEVTRCSGANDDIEGVADLLERVTDAGLFPDSHAIGLDQIGAATLPDVLAQRGFSMGELDSQLQGVPQGFRMNGFITGLERKLRDGTFAHGGQRLMSWAVSNARIEAKGNSVLITKQVSGRSKIDPVIAMLNAFGMMIRGPEGQAASVYEERGVLIL